MTFHKTPEDASSRYGTKYASLPLGWILFTNFSYFIVVLAGVFGFISAKSGRLWWICLSVFITWLVVHAVFFGGGRFHFPLMPLMAAYAAQFLSDPKKSYESLSRSRKGIAYIALIILSTLWFVEGYMIIHA